MEVNIIMKNKFVKTWSLGICCIMFSVLVSSYLPQNNKISLNPIPTYKIVINQFVDPPYH